ncbi:hypothetical protein TNCT_433801, partial [Trichonephila clavata]
NDEYLPPDEENISSDEDTVYNFPAQCTSRKPTSWNKRQSVNKCKKLSDSNPDEITSGTFVTKMEHIGKASPLEVACLEELLNIMFSKKIVPQPVMAKRNIENGYTISSWKLLIDESMLRHIKNCIEEEAHRQLGKDERSITFDELSALYQFCILKIYMAQIIYSLIVYGQLFGVNLLSVILWRETDLENYRVSRILQKKKKNLHVCVDLNAFKQINYVSVSFLKFGRNLVKIRELL